MTKQHEAYGYEGEVVETKEEREAREKREAAVGTPAEVAKAVSEEERVAKEEEEEAGKERVVAKIQRLMGALRGGRLFGAERKGAWGELEGAVGRLRSDQLVGELTEEEKKEKAEREKAEKERKAAEEKERKAEAKAEKW